MADLVEVCVEVIFKTDKAIKVLDMNGEEQWIPFSLIDNLIDKDDLLKKDNVIFEIPEWLAYEKELI